jgi:hypothetical protein
MSMLFKQSMCGVAKMLMIVPIILEVKREPSVEETMNFKTRLTTLLQDYLRSHGLSGSLEELDSLAQDKILEGIDKVQAGLSAYHAIQNQHAANLRQQDGLKQVEAQSPECSCSAGFDPECKWKGHNHV